jgi:UDP-glucose 4-epimerase
VPEIFGFDPRLQFVHEDDVVGALMYATVHDVPGVYNVAGDGVVPWSEVCKIVSKRRVALPPVLTNWAAEPLRVARILNMPPELLDLLRFGRGLDNTRFQRAGFRYRHTTAGAIEAFARGLRLKSAVGEKNPTPYKYEREIEDFFRHSSAVVRSP